MKTIPYLNMQAEVVIESTGDGAKKELLFNHVSSIEITESLKELSSTATIVLPRFYQKLENKSPLEYIKCGDKVWIRFGYKETQSTGTLEFEGFIKEIGSETPLELKCDQLYKLRQKNHSKSFRSVKLRELLNYITQGTFIKKIECPDVNLGRYEVNNTSTYQELVKLKEQFGFFSRVFDDKLKVGFAYDWNDKSTANHIYKIQANVRSSDLTYKLTESFNVRYRVNIRNAKDKEAFKEAGSTKADATLCTLEYSVADEAQAKKVLESKSLENLSGGYTGNITGFGFPVTKAGDSLTIIDNKDPGRNGTYLIEKVVKTYGPGGISRKNELAFKVNY